MADKEVGNGATDSFKLPELAGYIANALRESHEAAWPDSDQGLAIALLSKDLGEFAVAIVACARPNYWSPALAMQRLFIERTEVLLGAVYDHRVAKRYVSMDAKDPDAQRVEPAKRARPEDVANEAREAFLRAVGLPPEVVTIWRDAFLVLKGNASDWFVHPNAIGPLASRKAQLGEEPTDAHWGGVLRLLSWGCLAVLYAGWELRVALPVKVARAIDGAAKGLSQLGEDDMHLSEIFSVLQERASFGDPNTTEN